jgi:hypothetical protein
MLSPEATQNQRAQETNSARSGEFLPSLNASPIVLLSTSFAAINKIKELPRSEKTKAHTGNNKVEV